MIDPQKMLSQMIAKNASDLHMHVGYRPILRISADSYPYLDAGVVSNEDVLQFLLAITTKEQQDYFYLNKELDFSIETSECRFRANAFYERGHYAISIRYIPRIIPTIEQLRLPPILHSFTQYTSGLVLITGQTGEGKSTTLASLINEINLNRATHIITIEDPVEFVFPIGKSIISQREVKKDTLSFNNALRSTLREDPDIIVVGEMRDYETIASVITLAETGHLVFSTLHTGTASDTVNRIIDVFPDEQQEQIRSQLANVLRAIVCQRLVPRSSDNSQVAACEILLTNSAVKSLIREGKSYQIDNVLQTSLEDGMILFEKYLKDLVVQGTISQETAKLYSMRPRLIDELLH